MKRYPAYKDSGVDWLGEVPEGWEVVPVKAAFNVIGGTTPKTDVEDYWDGEIPWITPADLSSLDTRFVYTSNRKITDAGLASCGTTLFDAGSIILSTRAPIGSLAICSEEMCVNQGCKALSPRNDNVADFYYFALLAAKEALNILGRGSTFLELSGEQLASFRLPLPPIPEQQAIAGFLDREVRKIDTLVQEQRRLIALLAEKRQAVISHAVTRGLNPATPLRPSGIDWLGDIPEGWEVARLKHAKAKTPNSFVDGPFGSNLKSEHYVEGGDVYIVESSFATQGRIDEEELKTITSEHFGQIARSECHAGDIIIAKIGAYFGRCSILPALSRRAVVSGNSLKLTVDQTVVSTRFARWMLFHLKVSGAIDDIVSSTAQPALSLGEMNNLPFILPPLIEQEEIVAFVDSQTAQLDALTTAATSAIALLQERRAALISAAVTGKIDLRDISSQSLSEPEPA